MAEGGGACVGVSSEEGAEMALVMETEAVADLLYGERCGEEQGFGLPHEVVVDAVARRVACDLLHHVGHILG